MTSETPNSTGISKTNRRKINAVTLNSDWIGSFGFREISEAKCGAPTLGGRRTEVAEMLSSV